MSFRQEKLCPLSRRAYHGRACLEVQMFGKILLCFTLVASLSCFSQVVNSGVASTGGYATTAGPTVTLTPANAANAPLVSTPDVALPGSGPAVGAPLAGNTNDARTSTAPSVADRNGIGPMIPENAATANQGAAPGVGTTGVSNSATEPFEFGIQHFESSAPAGGNALPSLGDIARQYRGQRRQVRTFTNDSIAQLNRAGVQTGNLGAGTSVVASSSQNRSSVSSQQPTQGTLMAQNQTPALPQSDQAASEPAQQPSLTARQQRHAAVTQAPVTETSPPQPGSATQQPSATASQNAAAPQKSETTSSLPQTGSVLPLLLVIGAIGAGGGALYLLRR